MQTVILLFDRITALDAVGPYEVLSRLPGGELTFVAPEAGTVTTDNKLLNIAVEQSIDDVARADILLVPGGWGTRALETDQRVLSWLQKIHETTSWTTSVCTGSLVLGAAGLLTDKPATTHWACYAELEKHGAEVTAERVVFADKIVTAAGVSAGIDMALALAARVAGEQVAQAIQLGIEYDPQPPFDCGSPAKADPVLVAMLRDCIGRK